MKKQQKILISKDIESIEAFKNSLDAMLPYLKRMVYEFNCLKVGQIKETSHLQDAYQNANDFYTKNLINSTVVPDSMAEFYSKEELSKLRNLPDPKLFFKSNEAALRVFPHNLCSIHHFVIDENGDVAIDKASVEAVVEQNSVYADADDEIRLYNALNKAAIVMNEIKNAYEAIAGKSPFVKYWSVQNQSNVIAENFITCENDGSMSRDVVKIEPSYKLVNQAKRNRVLIP